MTLKTDSQPFNTHSYRARWLIPVDGEPIENGTIEIRDGVISAVHGRLDPRSVDLGNVAIVPGLVNTHTHLEFSELGEPLPQAQRFTDWIRSVVAHRRNRAVETCEALRGGLLQCTQNGTTLVGEIATEGWTPDTLMDAGPRVVLFREFISRSPEMIDQQIAMAREHLAGMPDRTSTRVVRGLCPHAPYSVHPDLYLKLIDLAVEYSSPLAIHLAETESELELLARGTGDLVDMLREFGVWKDGVIPTGVRPIDYLRPLARLPNALVVHGNLLADDEIDFLAQHHNLAVIYCPRTHAYFGHRTHPWCKMLERGILVAVGTDSRASNPDLSVWRELLFLRGRNPQFCPAMLLQLGTLNGARALTLDRTTGSLMVGKRADLAVIALPSRASGDVYSILFQPKTYVQATMCEGRWPGTHESDRPSGE